MRRSFINMQEIYQNPWDSNFMKSFMSYSYMMANEFPSIKVNGPEVFSKVIKVEFSVYKEVVAMQK
jgi:hypothetical protein